MHARLTAATPAWPLTLVCLRREQQYNDLRENKFKEWKFNNKTWFPIVLMSAILPVACYKMTKAELVRCRIGRGAAGRGIDVRLCLCFRARTANRGRGLS